ncbi:MAG TPA: RNA polymerase sigma factor [Gaiellaceae bacterium]|nr:RNA polymerase sigma factor [Gaiellaceae bacterium]
MAVAPEASRVVLAPNESETAELLFQEHSGWIYGYCLRLLRSPEEAEDALQTTYLNACRSLNQGTRPQVGSAWLLRIAQNVCFARMRSSGRRGKLERVQDITVLEETVAAPERSPEALIGLTDALCSLPERQREAILLREWQGLSYHEVGSRLGLSQAAVETLIFRARRSLAAALEDPGKRDRRTSLRALDVGGLAAAIKGFFAGGAAAKAAVLAVAAATTATVVAVDPGHVWRDRSDPGTSRSELAAEKSSPASRSSRSDSAALSPAIVAPAELGRPAVAYPAEKPRTKTERGRKHGQETATAAKGKEKTNNGNGGENGKALGHNKEAGTPASPHGGQSPGNGTPESAGRGETGPPAHAQADGQAKQKSQ